MTEVSTWHCSVDGCDRPFNPHAAKGLCKAHYERARKLAKGKRYCTVEGCDRPAQSLLCYAHAREARRGTICSVDACISPVHTRGWCDAHYRRYAKYGLQPEQFDRLVSQQGGGCGICGVSEADSSHPLVVDHDHGCCPGARSCGRCVRGILCRACNVGIGLLNDDKQIVLAAYRYLAGGDLN